MLMLLRLIKHLLVFVFVCIPMQLLGMIVLAVVLPFIPAKTETLPKSLSWFDNYSGRLFGYPTGDGLSGDPNYRMSRALAGHTNLFWERYTWLALRNPYNVFGYTVLGVTPGSVSQKVDVGEPDPNANGGFLYSRTVVDGKIYYSYYYVKHYDIMSMEKVFYFRFGWKFGGSQPLIPGQTAQWCLNLNPWREV